MRLFLRALTPVLLLLLILPRPAEAAPAAQKFEAHLGSITLAPSGADKSTLLWVRIQPAAPDSEHHLEVTVDFGPAAAFAEMDLEVANIVFTSAADGAYEDPSSAPDSGPCHRTDSTLSCAWDMAVSDDTVTPVGVAVARPTKDAKTGDSAQLVMKARIDEGTWTTSESVIQVGEGVDLDAGDEEKISAAPGRTAEATPMIRNAGATPIDGTFMYLAAAPKLLGRTSFSNCRYGNAVLCEFDTVLQPGKKYGLSSPILLRPPADAAGGSTAQSYVQWITKSEWASWAEFASPRGEYGTGNPLTLEEAVSAMDVPQADVEDENNSSAITLTVTGSARPDLAAIGSRRTVAVGDRVTIDVGLRNLGPGTMHPELFDNNGLAVLVTLPDNVQTVKVDPWCFPLDDDEDFDGDVGEVREFLCRIMQTVASRKSATVSFELDVDQRGHDAGSVQVLNGMDGRAKPAANDIAKIMLTVPGADLPITGPGVLGPAAAGLVLVLTGFLLAVRRNRRSAAGVIHSVGK